MENPYNTTPPQIPPPSFSAPKESAWHKVLGIMAIVFGGGATLVGLISWVTNKAAKQMTDGIMDSVPEMKAFMATNETLLYVTIPIVQSVLGLLCLAGGIALLGRRPSGKSILLFWSLCKIVCSLAILPTQMGMAKLMPKFQQAMLKDMSKSAPEAEQMGKMMGGMMESMAVVSTILGTLWYMAFPVFLIIWFGRKKIREQVAGWKNSRDVQGPHQWSSM